MIEDKLQRKIIEKLEDEDNWPCFRELGQIYKLTDLGNKYFLKQNMEGLLSSVLMYHSALEKMMINLLMCSNFFLQLESFPWLLDDYKLDRLSHSQLINRLKEGIMSNDMSKFLDLAQKVNKGRNDIVHDVASNIDLDILRKECKVLNKDYNKTLKIYNILSDRFHFDFWYYHENHLNGWKDEYL